MCELVDQYQSIEDELEAAKGELLTLILDDSGMKQDVIDSAMSKASLRLNNAIYERKQFKTNNPDFDCEPKHFFNPQGFKVLIANVEMQDQLKEKLVTRLISRATLINKIVTDFQENSYYVVKDHMERLASEYDVEFKSGRGNVQLSSYNMKKRVTIGVIDQTSFGPEMAIAKVSIDKFADKELSGSDSELIRAIAMDAFTTNTQGSYSKSKISGLRRYRTLSNDPDWLNGMNAIDRAVIADGSKTYLRFHERNEMGEWIQIPLISKSIKK